jgi:hypothetical protein
VEYLILLTLIIPAAISFWILSKAKGIGKIKKLEVSQSRSLRLFGDILEAEMKYQEEGSKIKTQSTEHFDKSHTRILVYEDKAYWITNNQVFAADFVGGTVDPETTGEVDTIAMDDVQLKKMIFIVEKLTEGLKNEDRNSGNQGL